VALVAVADIARGVLREAMDCEIEDREGGGRCAGREADEEARGAVGADAKEEADG